METPTIAEAEVNPDMPGIRKYFGLFQQSLQKVGLDIKFYERENIFKVLLREGICLPVPCTVRDVKNHYCCFRLHKESPMTYYEIAISPEGIPDLFSSKTPPPL